MIKSEVSPPSVGEVLSILNDLPLSRFALSCVDGLSIEFFEVVERNDGARSIIQLLWGPNGWVRVPLGARHMAAIGHVFVQDIDGSIDRYLDFLIEFFTI